MERNVLVTGASTGIGFAIACELAVQGYRVHAGVRREADAQVLASAGAGRIRPVLLDVTSDDQRRAALQSACGDDGTLFALVNNAGRNLTGPFEEHDGEAARRLLEVNLFGASDLMRLAIPRLRAHAERYGTRPHVVNVSSIGGAIGFPWEAFYHASKFALVGLSESVRQELAPQGINVSVVMPGGVRTPFLAKTTAELDAAMRLLEHADARERYAPGLERMKRTAGLAERLGSAPRLVARRVRRILGTKRPRLHHLVGFDARLLYALHRALPNAWAHAAWAPAFGTQRR